MVFALQVTRTGNLAAGAPSVPGSTQTSSLSYFHHDHLGSIAAITDENRNVVERLAYDPWGKRRYADGAFDATDSLTGKRTDRGYTEHEHLDEMGIIHMNGRVYDPLIGRFMSADPHIQAPYNLKSFNRYSYVWNNPLKLFDPTGYDTVDISPPGNEEPPGTVPVDCGPGCTTNLTTRDRSGPVNGGQSFTQGVQNLGNAIVNGFSSIFGGGSNSGLNTRFSVNPYGDTLVGDNPFKIQVVGGADPGSVGVEGVFQVMERYRRLGYEIVDIEVRASITGFGYTRRYDFVTRSLEEPRYYIGVEVKASEIGIFRLDRRQVDFDTAMLTTSSGAQAIDRGYSINGVRYEGVDITGNINARWQQGYLYRRLQSLDVEPRRTPAPP
jgi:RHS repeat-associated protein